MTHKLSVVDREFQVQTRRECIDIQNELMVDSSKRGWLLTTALARWIQHTKRWNDIRVTAILPENASVCRPLVRR